MVNLTKIRALCKKNRITLKRLAEDIGITETGLQYILNNNTTSLENLEKIAQYFNVSVGHFFDEKEIYQNNGHVLTANGRNIIQKVTEKECMEELLKNKKKLDDAMTKIIELQEKIIYLQDAMSKRDFRD